MQCAQSEKAFSNVQNDINHNFQTCFVNNPISGGLTLAATFVAGREIGLGTLLGGSVATISEMVSAVE